jgi:hypothetical protein
MQQNTTHRFACSHCAAVYMWAMDQTTKTVYFQFECQTAPVTKPTDKGCLQLLDPQWRMAHTGEDMVFRTHCADRTCRTTIEWAKKIKLQVKK